MFQRPLAHSCDKGTLFFVQILILCKDVPKHQMAVSAVFRYLEQNPKHQLPLTDRFVSHPVFFLLL